MSIVITIVLRLYICFCVLFTVKPVIKTTAIDQYDKRPLLKLTCPYISIHVYLWSKTICHIKPLYVVLWGGLSSQVSLYISIWSAQILKLLYYCISTIYQSTVNVMLRFAICPKMALHFYIFIHQMKDHLSYKTTFCEAVVGLKSNGD